MVIIEAKLELRDSTSWDTLDRAIKRVGGATSAVLEGSVKAAGASASAALLPGDSDDEDEAGVIICSSPLFVCL